MQPSINEVSRTASLEHSEEKYRSLFMHIDQGFCVIEVLFDSVDRPADYRFIEINPAFERHTGLRDAVGKSMRALAPAHEEHWFQIYGQVAKTGKAVHFENAARALERYYEVYAYRVGPPEDRRVGVLFKDITRRKHDEELLRDMDRRKDEFIATLAHELRNPLAPIRSSVDLLKHPDVDLATAKSAASMMERQVGYLVRLVDDLLYISRIASGKLELRHERVDLSEIIQDAIDMSRSLLDAGDQEITMNVPGGPIEVTADRVRITQVIANLVNNAAKYSARRAQIRISASREADHAVIRVKDFGIGIAADMLPRIFDMFMQARPEDREDGLGIGLTLAKRLVELHGGSLSARSEGPGKGSDFYVRLPIGQASKAGDPSNAAKSQVAPRKPRRVLVVDDNTDAADSMRMLLELEGHEIETANDGIRALEIAQGFKPEIAFIDLGMPGMDGYEVARRMADNPQMRYVKLVALTGWGQPNDRLRTAQAGFAHHLTKPVAVAELQRLLEEMPAPNE